MSVYQKAFFLLNFFFDFFDLYINLAYRKHDFHIQNLFKNEKTIFNNKKYVINIKNKWKHVQIVKNIISEVPQSIVHCFTGNKNELKKFLDLGLYIGITGWICDPNRGQELREIVKYVPLDRMLIETDAPYLIPKDINSKPKNNRNEPMHLEHILSVISNLIDQDKKVVAQHTTKNFKNLFRL